jgi:TonB family protein
MTITVRGLSAVGGLTFLAAPALVAAAATPALPDSPPQPSGNPGGWVTANDYPHTSDPYASGTTQFQLAVDALGKVTDCTITQSSGHAELDAATCQLLRERAAFVPAMHAGKPVRGTYSNSVLWQKSRDSGEPRMPTPYRQQLIYTIAADGTVAGCEGVDNEGNHRTAGPGTELIECPAGKQFPIPRDAAGKPVARRVTATFTLTVDDVR